MSSGIEPYRRRANYYETDQMGIVHHSNYIRWMEEARLDYMSQTGMNYADVEKLGILIPVVKVSCEYKNSIYYNEIFTIRTKMVRFNGVNLDYSYEILTEDGRIAATGESGHCFLNTETRIPFHLKKKFPELYQSFMRLFQQDQDAGKE